MLNAQELDSGFVSALRRSWDERAIWPGCKDLYTRGTSPDCYGQCLVGTLHAWSFHGGEEKGFHLIPGVAYGPGLPETGVWHFQLGKALGGKIIPIDLTWHQFRPGVRFVPAPAENNSADFAMIMRGSLMKDASLVPRAAIIAENLDKNGIKSEHPRAIVSAAQKYFLRRIVEAKQSSAISLYEPESKDWDRVGDALSDFTDKRGASNWNPLSFAFRAGAEETGRPIAEAIATINQGEAELNLLFVEESQRGKRVGKAFVEEFEKIAKVMGSVSAIVKTPSWQGEGYYTRLGYQEFGRYPIHPNAENKPQFNIFYYKDLRT